MKPHEWTRKGHHPTNSSGTGSQGLLLQGPKSLSPSQVAPGKVEPIGESGVRPGSPEPTSGSLSGSWSTVSPQEEGVCPGASKEAVSGPGKGCLEILHHAGFVPASDHQGFSTVPAQLAGCPWGQGMETSPLLGPLPCQPMALRVPVLGLPLCNLCLSGPQGPHPRGLGAAFALRSQQVGTAPGPPPTPLGMVPSPDPHPAGSRICRSRTWCSFQPHEEGGFENP